VIVHPLPDRAAREIGPLYASMGRRFAEMCSSYDEGELALILDFITRSHQLNREETTRLRGQTPSEEREGGEFAAPLESVTSGRLVFERGASDIFVGVDPSMGDLLRAPRGVGFAGSSARRYRHRSPAATSPPVCG
jgi:hypothetical protein